MTPIEALMEAEPQGPIEFSQIELLSLREVLQDAIEEALTAEEAWVFNALIVERLSVRQLGRQISVPKTTITRIRDRALGKLREHLLEQPAIRDYLERA